MNRDLDYLELLECIGHIENYTYNVEKDSFLRNEEKKDACLTRILENIIQKFLMILK